MGKHGNAEKRAGKKKPVTAKMPRVGSVTPRKVSQRIDSDEEPASTQPPKKKPRGRDADPPDRSYEVDDEETDSDVPANTPSLPLGPILPAKGKIS